MNPCANCTPRESHASITWCSTSRKDLEGKDKGQEEEIKEDGGTDQKQYLI